MGSTPKAVEAKKPKAEQFIGHDAMTMMGDETFAQFEARAKASEEVTGAMPARAVEARAASADE